MRIHAWIGERYYPKGPVSDYLGNFEDEGAAKAAVGTVNEEFWATLMQEEPDGKLAVIRTWNEWQGFPAGWRDWDPDYD